MSRCRFVYVCASLLLVGLLLAGKWSYRDAQTLDFAWTIDRTEHVVLDVLTGQEIKTTFNLKNTSRRPLRILGSSAC